VFREGCCFLIDRPLETFESSQLGPWPDYTGSPIDADQIPVRELTGGEGQVRGNAQGLTAVSGVAGVGEERGRGGVTAVNRDGRRRSKGCRRCSGGRRAEGWRESGQGASTR
jgi:hypothetical protein